MTIYVSVSVTAHKIVPGGFQHRRTNIDVFKFENVILLLYLVYVDLELDLLFTLSV